MSAARNIPYENNPAAYPITIGPGFTPAPQGVKLGVSQPITFTNNSGAEIASVVFQANPPLPLSPGPILYPNTLTNLANGATSAELTPNYAEGSVNYFITDEGGKQYGPFSIQLGAGTAIPLMIAILNSQTYPATAAVPAQGAAAIYSADQPCVQYGISWGGAGSPFTIGTPKAACGFSPSAIRTATTAVNTYPFNIVNPAEAPGGKVVIQS
jgi:hypothetical protein